MSVSIFAYQDSDLYFGPLSKLTISDENDDINNYYVNTINKLNKKITKKKIIEIISKVSGENVEVYYNKTDEIYKFKPFKVPVSSELLCFNLKNRRLEFKTIENILSDKRLLLLKYNYFVESAIIHEFDNGNIKIPYDFKLGYLIGQLVILSSNFRNRVVFKDEQLKIISSKDKIYKLEKIIPSAYTINNQNDSELHISDINSIELLNKFFYKGIFILPPWVLYLPPEFLYGVIFGIIQSDSIKYEFNINESNAYLKIMNMKKIPIDKVSNLIRARLNLYSNTITKQIQKEYKPNNDNITSKSYTRDDNEYINLIRLDSNFKEFVLSMLENNQLMGDEFFSKFEEIINNLDKLKLDNYNYLKLSEMEPDIKDFTVIKKNEIKIRRVNLLEKMEIPVINNSDNYCNSCGIFIRNT